MERILRFKLLASRRPFHIIKSFVIPVGLLVPVSWVPTFISEKAPRIIAGTTVLGITWAALSNRPRGTELTMGCDDCVDYYCNAIFLQVASSLFQSAVTIILTKKENLKSRALLRRQRRRGGRRYCCMRSIGRAILECIPYLNRQGVERANADNSNVEAGDVQREDGPPAVQHSTSTSSSCNSLFHIVSPIVYLLVLSAMSLHVVLNHTRMSGIGTPINLIKIKTADRLILENI